MPRSYSQLRDKVLTLCDQTGSTDATAVVQVALEETLKYIASQVELPGLLSSATATWGAATTSLGIVADFVVSDYASPDRLYVKKDAATAGYGVPYDYVEWLHWNDLKAIPAGDIRSDLWDVNVLDERPNKAWTINFDDEILIEPYATDNVLTLVYFKEPAAYTDGGFPEIPPKWDYILVNGATLILKEWLREGDIIIDAHSILKALDPQIALMDMEMNSKRQRGNLKISHRYRIR